MATLNSILERLMYSFKGEYLFALEQELESIFLMVKQTNSIEAASIHFAMLERIQVLLARLIFKEGVTVSPRLRRFVRDFDRLDSNEFRRQIYSEISSDKYSF